MAVGTPYEYSISQQGVQKSSVCMIQIEVVCTLYCSKFRFPSPQKENGRNGLWLVDIGSLATTKWFPMAHPPFSGGLSWKEAFVEVKCPPCSAWVGLVWGGGAEKERKRKTTAFFSLSGDYCFGMEIHENQKKIKKNPNSAESGREVSRDLERTAEIWRSPNLLKILKDQFGIFPNIWINPKIWGVYFSRDWEGCVFYIFGRLSIIHHSNSAEIWRTHNLQYSKPYIFGIPIPNLYIHIYGVLTFIRLCSW